MALIALLGCGFLTNSVTSKAVDRDTNFSISKSLVENTAKPTPLNKKFKGEQSKTFKENKLAEIEFEEKRVNRENSNSQLDN